MFHPVACGSPRPPVRGNAVFPAAPLDGRAFAGDLCADMLIVSSLRRAAMRRVTRIIPAQTTSDGAAGVRTGWSS